MKLISANYESPRLDQGTFLNVIIQDSAIIHQRLNKYLAIDFEVSYLKKEQKVVLETIKMEFYGMESDEHSSNRRTTFSIPNPDYDAEIEGSEERTILPMFTYLMENAGVMPADYQMEDFGFPTYEKVMQYFLDEYQAGRTPNPDVMCNKIIKFGLFYDWAMKQGYDAIATGHYAKADGQFLYVPKDKIKDQTYFLYQIRQEQLAHVVFPLAELTKQAVRQLAHQAKLPVADKKDSVGICFVGDINVPKFLAENLGTKPGKIVDEHGNILGQHRGLWFHTVGQRHGFNYDKKKNAQLNPILHKDELPAMYVIDKNIKANELVIGPKQATRVKTLHVSNLHLLGLTQAELFKRTDLRVRIRHTGQLTDCEIKKMGNRYSVKLKQLVEGVASGQSAVFYTYEKAGRCLGGATIN